jgi:hypothetical protein
MQDKPDWWTSVHALSWELAKEALRRDWIQTKFDVGAGGHQLNQNAADTLGQAVGEAVLPPIEVANRPTVIGRWEDAEVAIGFGYAARLHYGDRYPLWSSELERRLRRDWKNVQIPWGKAALWVRHGYEAHH